MGTFIQMSLGPGMTISRPLPRPARVRAMWRASASSVQVESTRMPRQKRSISSSHGFNMNLSIIGHRMRPFNQDANVTKALDAVLHLVDQSVHGRDRGQGSFNFS